MGELLVLAGFKKSVVFAGTKPHVVSNKDWPLALSDKLLRCLYDVGREWDGQADTDAPSLVTNGNVGNPGASGFNTLEIDTDIKHNGHNTVRFVYSSNGTRSMHIHTEAVERSIYFRIYHYFPDFSDEKFQVILKESGDEWINAYGGGDIGECKHQYDGGYYDMSGDVIDADWNLLEVEFVEAPTEKSWMRVNGGTANEQTPAFSTDDIDALEISARKQTTPFIDSNMSELEVYTDIPDSVLGAVVPLEVF